MISEHRTLQYVSIAFTGPHEKSVILKVHSDSCPVCQFVFSENNLTDQPEYLKVLPVQGDYKRVNNALNPHILVYNINLVRAPPFHLI